MTGLRRNKRGTIIIWVTCLIALVVMGFGWFALSGPAYLIMDEIEAVYTPPPEARPTLALTKHILGWALIVLGLGLLGWALIPRREEVTYPVG